jgi:hypothetical protein
MPQGEAIFPAGHCDEDTIAGLKHGKGLNGSRDLFVHERREAALAEGGIVPWEADHCFGLTFPTVHDDP